MEGFLETGIHQSADIGHTLGSNNIEELSSSIFFGFNPAAVNLDYHYQAGRSLRQC